MTVNTENIVTSFIQSLQADGKGPKTILSYSGDVKAFPQWLENKGQSFHGHFSRFHITRYLNQLQELNYTPNTINKKVNSLHCFNHFLINQKLMQEKVVFPNKDKIKIARGSEAEVAVFSEPELERLLFYIEDQAQVSQRDKVVVLLLLYTGLRVSELVNIRLKDLDLLALNLKVVGKGGKYREIPLKSEVAEAVQIYLEADRKAHKHATSPYLLLTQRAGRMDKDTVNKLLRKIGNRIDLDIHPHKFRHTFCSRLVQLNVPLTTVSKLAGHASIQTTAHFYINTSRQDKEQAVSLL